MTKSKLNMFLLATAVGLSCIGKARAAATIEFYNDQGIYSGVPAGSQPMQAFPFAFGGYTFDLNNTVPPDPIEGLKNGRLTINDQWGGWGIQFMNGANPTTQDLSGYEAMRFWLKSTEALQVEVQYGPLGTPVDITLASTGGLWQEINLPLSSFTGVNLAQIRVPFIIKRIGAPVGPTTIYVDHIRWTKPLASLVMFPPTTTVQSGHKRQFTVEGRSSSGENVIVYPTFSAPASIGSFNPVISVVASTFTAATNSGNANATFGGFTASSLVNISASPINKVLGLYTESISPSIVLNTDSSLNVSISSDTTTPTLLDESNSDSPEGVKRFKTTINAQFNATSFSGWYIQWNTNTSNTLTRDMSDFYEGSLRFWFKGPAALQPGLEISMRSGNTEGGTELSKVKLANYTTFDNAWHSVVIPIKAFTGARPWADLSRTKVLFGAFVTGQLFSAQTFYIDNIRWDTTAPGPLASIVISPANVSVPLGGKRRFTAQGFDSNNIPVDVFPTWSKTDLSGNIGSLSPAQGPTTLLSANNANATGRIQAQQGTILSNVNVTVQDVIWTQSFNVYSDNGSGGYVGVAKGPNGTVMNLSELNLGVGVAPEGSIVRHADYSLVNTLDQQDGFAIWFTNSDDGNGVRFMHYYESGYLSFWVKTSKDLQVAIRSANIPAGAERSKFRLSELGIPTDDTWQKVVIGLSDFKTREPLLDFDQIQTYIAIGAVSAQIGPVTNQNFEVDDVKWLTNNPGVPDADHVYTGLQEKQQPGGLVRSFETLPRAVTYDQALAVMNFTYKKDLVLSQRLFNVYKNIYDNYGGPFAGFHEEYNVSSTASSYQIINGNRTAGPNAWMLLALIHYRNVSGSTAYDSVISGLASWLLSLQDTDGAIRFGFSTSTPAGTKSTEHNLDCVAAFNAYAQMTGNNTYGVAAGNIRQWLNTQMFDANQHRFYVGKRSDGSINTDRALDVYSWAPLALSTYFDVLPTAVTDFRTTKIADLTGIAVTGFDFSGPPTQPVDKDAVWLEGTAQMALAYYFIEDNANGDFYLQELDKAIINTSSQGQGLAYATNGGTAYGFTMDSLNPAASSAAWYLFARNRFNPFSVFPIHNLTVNLPFVGPTAGILTWTATIPTRWVRANEFLKLDVQPISIDSWGLQIYTDNTNPALTPHFADPTPANPNNFDSNPAGLMRALPTEPVTPYTLSLAWSVKDTSATASIPVAEDPTSGSPASFQWVFMKDRRTPNIPNVTTAFQDGAPEITVRRSDGLHITQDPNDFVPNTFAPDYIYVEADFSNASAQTPYTTQIIAEFFLQ